MGILQLYMLHHVEAAESLLQAPYQRHDGSRHSQGELGAPLQLHLESCSWWKRLLDHYNLAIMATQVMVASCSMHASQHSLPAKMQLEWLDHVAGQRIQPAIQGFIVMG
jgi:hypothetical protein